MSSRGDRRPSAQAVLDPLREGMSAGALRSRLLRLRSRAWLILQIGVGATLAWVVAHDLLGHTLPFFAPITAMVCLGLTYGNRVRRIIELTTGVAIGILVGDLAVHWLGTGPWQIGLVAVIAMSLAVLAGAGQLLMMQAGIQGVIITVLVAGEGQALSRWLDGVVGGAVALVIAMLAPRRSTTQRPRERAVALVGHLAEVLTETAQSLRSRDHDRSGRALDRARELSEELEELRDATAEATAAARLAPLLARADRADVVEVDRMIRPLDLAIRNVRVLTRRAEAAVEADEYVPDTYTDMVAELAEASGSIHEALATRTPLTAVQEELVSLARRSTWSHPAAALSAEVMRGQLRSTVVDLLVLSGMSLADARRRVPATRDEMDPRG